MGSRFFAILLTLALIFLTACSSQNFDWGSEVPVEVLPLNADDVAIMEDIVQEEVVFSIEAKGLRFFMDGVESPELRVKEGSLIRIEFANNKGFHDWVLDEFGAATEQIRSGKTDVVEFVADKKGSFEYYCSVDGHRNLGMKGLFIVE